MVPGVISSNLAYTSAIAAGTLAAPVPRRPRTTSGASDSPCTPFPACSYPQECKRRTMSSSFRASVFVPAGRRNVKTTHSSHHSQRVLPGRTVLPPHLPGFFSLTWIAKRPDSVRSIPAPRYSSVNSACKLRKCCNARVHRPARWSGRSPATALTDNAKPPISVRQTSLIN